MKLISFSHHFLRVIRCNLEEIHVINKKHIIKDVSQISARAQKSALLRKSAHPYDHIDKQVPFLNKRPSPPPSLSQVIGLLQTPFSIASPF